MSIELNRSTFRRLVQLYLLSFAAVLAAYAIEALTWSDFHAAFDRLQVEHFGEPSDLQLFSLGGLGLAGSIAHVVAAVGLLKFKRWSKKFFWASLLLVVPLTFIPGFEVSWTGGVSMWLESINMALLGAIVLLAYSLDHGSKWFEDSAKSVEQIGKN